MRSTRAEQLPTAIRGWRAHGPPRDAGTRVPSSPQGTQDIPSVLALPRSLCRKTSGGHRRRVLIAARGSPTETPERLAEGRAFVERHHDAVASASPRSIVRRRQYGELGARLRQDYLVSGDPVMGRRRSPRWWTCGPVGSAPDPSEAVRRRAVRLPRRRSRSMCFLLPRGADPRVEDVGDWPATKCSSQLTFVASANAVEHVGPTTPFSSIRSRNEPDRPERAEAADSSYARTHAGAFRGTPSRHGRAQTSPREVQLVVVEDAAHAIGADGLE